MGLDYVASPSISIAGDLIENRLINGAPVLFHVPSTSMLPALRPGDRVLVSAIPVAHAPIGALIVLRRDNIWIVHRLIRRHRTLEGWQLVTKGDRCRVPDPVWKGVETAAIVQAILRDGRHIQLTSLSTRWAGKLLALLSAFEADLAALPIHHRGLRRVVRLSLDGFTGGFRRLFGGN